MSNPAPAPTAIPRKDLARYVTDERGQPIEKLIQDIESQQEFLLGGVGGGTFLTAVADPALPASRSIAAGTRINLVDTGAGGTLTINVSDQNVILPADVSDVTGAFVNAPGLAGTLAAASVYVVEGLLTFQSAGAGVGIGLGFTLPAGATISGSYNHNVTTTTLQGAYNTAAGAVSANTTAVPVINTNIPIHGRWIIRTTIAGTAQLQFRTATAATAVTLKQDLSTLSFQKIG